MEKGLQKIEWLLQEYEIPPHPHVLSALDEAFRQGNPSTETLAVLISGDVALAARILQLANAQYYGLHQSNEYGRINHLADAILFLGKHRIQDLVREMNCLVKMNGWVKETPFWDYSADVGIFSSYLSQRLLCVDPKDAYLLGLFHDAGVLILIQAFPDYVKNFKSLQSICQPIDPALEQKTFGFDHQMLGYRLALQWGFSPLICRAILSHHDLDDPRSVPDQFSYDKNVLISVLQLAEKISYRFRSMWRDDWIISKVGEIHPHILQYLEISKSDAEDLMEDTFDKVEELLKEYKR